MVPDIRLTFQVSGEKSYGWWLWGGSGGGGNL